MGNSFFGGSHPPRYQAPPQPAYTITDISKPMPQQYTRRPRSSSGSSSASSTPPRARSQTPITESSQYAYSTAADPEGIHKGLHNETAAYHCFLNVVIQSLWHLRAFRLRFISLDYNHVHRSSPCVFCALRMIFMQYEYSDSVIIPPDTLRSALHDLDAKQGGGGRFALGAQGDAEEALDEILRWLHLDQVQREAANNGQLPQDITCIPLCISHAVFGAHCMDVRVCRCGATSDPDVSTSFLYRVYVSDLLPRLQTTLPFSAILRSIYKQQSYSCPAAEAGQRQAGGGGGREAEAAACRGPALIDRWVLSVPIVFTLMFVWQQETSREQIASIWGALPPVLLLSDFLRVVGGAAGGVDGHELRGVICYYGRHYVAFFFSAAHSSWLMFDDRRVSAVGLWEELCERAIAGKLQPILAFYERREQDNDMLSNSKALAQTMEPEWLRREHEDSKAEQSRPQQQQQRAAAAAAAAAANAATHPISHGSQQPQLSLPSSSASSFPAFSSFLPTTALPSSPRRVVPVAAVESGDVFAGLDPMSHFATASATGGTVRR